jgi:cell division protein ZapA
MKSIKVNILGRPYPLKVEDDEEETMIKIAEYVDEKFRVYRRELSKQPDATVMVLAALSIAEEMFAARKKLHESRNNDEKILEGVNKTLDKLLEEISS